MKEFRVNPRDFSRQNSKNSKGLTFSNTVRMILTGLKCSYKKELSDFFNDDLMVSADDVPTGAAFCQARQKVKPDVFVDLNNRIVKDFYGASPWKDWHGFRLSAIDGSTAHVFDSTENVEFFKGWSARNGNGEVCPKARLSLAYDPLNGLILDAQMSPTSIGENALAERHMAVSTSQDLNIFDRGYLSYRLIAEHDRLDLHYCARVPIDLFTRLVDGFMESEEDDIVVEYTPTAPAAWKYEKKGGKARPVKVRLIKIALNTGETEVLATNVFDKRLVKSSFDELYRLRWGVEEEYKRLKCRDHVEDFSGTKIETMRQDFHSAIVRLNLSSLLSRQARLTLEQRGKKDKHWHAPNMSMALGHLNTILKSFRKDDCKKRLKTVLKNLTGNLVRESIPIRPNRKFPRIKKPERSGFSHSYKDAC
jgi:hypothetical protein